MPIHPGACHRPVGQREKHRRTRKRLNRFNPEGERPRLCRQWRSRQKCTAKHDVTERSAGGRLPAAIAAVHAQATDTGAPQILALYDLLKRLSLNNIVMPNHALAAAIVHGPAAGLELLNAIDAGRRLARHHRPDAVRAHLLERAGNNDPAIAHYRAGSARTASLPARNYLLTLAARLAAMKQ